MVTLVTPLELLYPTLRKNTVMACMLYLVTQEVSGPSVMIMAAEALTLSPESLTQEPRTPAARATTIDGCGVEASRTGGATPGETGVNGTPLGSLDGTPLGGGAVMKLGEPVLRSRDQRPAARGMAANENFASMEMRTLSRLLPAIRRGFGPEALGKTILMAGSLRRFLRTSEGRGLAACPREHAGPQRRWLCRASLARWTLETRIWVRRRGRT